MPAGIVLPCASGCVVIGKACENEVCNDTVKLDHDAFGAFKKKNSDIPDNSDIVINTIFFLAVRVVCTISLDLPYNVKMAPICVIH